MRTFLALGAGIATWTGVFMVIHLAVYAAFGKPLNSALAQYGVAIPMIAYMLQLGLACWLAIIVHRKVKGVTQYDRLFDMAREKSESIRVALVRGEISEEDVNQLLRKR